MRRGGPTLPPGGLVCGPVLCCCGRCLLRRGLADFSRQFSCAACRVGFQIPRLFLSERAVHPIRRHYTRSDRVQCPVTGAVPRNGCSVLVDCGVALPPELVQHWPLARRVSGACSRECLLLSGVTPLRWVLHQLGGGVMLPN